MEVKALLTGILKHPIICDYVQKIKGKVYKKIADLSAFAVISDEPVPREKLINEREIPVEKGFIWSEKKFGACWFHLVGSVPDGYDYKDKHNVVLMSIGGEGLGYDGEETVDIVTPVLSVTDVLQPPTAGKRSMELVKDGKVDCFVDCGYNGFSGKFLNKAKFRYAFIAEKDDAVCDYYYDFVTLALLLAGNDEKVSSVKAEIIEVLKKSYRKFSEGDILSAKAILKKYYDKEQDYESVLYTLIGQGHLDLAWLWPERESKRKGVRTLTNALSVIEKNKDYVFGASQAQMFEWVKESHPKLFERVKEAVASGNIELQGDMWVECDCNMPCGESLIRQFMYGEKFFFENFGKRTKTVWLPDAFGFPYTFPQIIRGVGKENFVTIKLSWNTVNKFPYQSFYWTAPDGSSVLCHISPEGSYYNDGTPLAIARAERENTQKDTGRALIIFGAGDGGGGPGEGHVEIAKRSQALYGTARAQFGTAESFFEDLKKAENLPAYDGELYLEKHQGTLTAQSKNKLMNRKAEVGLHNAEFLSALDAVRVDLSGMWKRLLFTQFHDVLPGSSIERVHRESVEDLQKIVDTTSEIVKEKLSAFCAGNGKSALNTSPFYRDEFLTIDGKSYRFTGRGYSASPLKEETPNLSVGKDFIENDFLKVTFSDTGTICSCFDKVNKKEIAVENLGLNVLTVFEDKKSKYDAWDIDINYRKKSEKPQGKVSTYICGARAIAEVKYEFGNSKITQYVSLSGNSIVTVDNKIDWRESYKMLRAEFFPTVYGDYAECDIQFGHIDRSTQEENSIDRAKFEVCAHKYLSVGMDDLSFAVYSNSKYGFRAKNGMISVNLLRSPKYPDENCDMGLHEFSYAFDVAPKREIVARGYNFNYPLITFDGVADIEPIITVDSENIIIETIKPCEEGQGIAVRMYERFGISTEVTVTVNKNYNALYLTDLLEKNPTETGNLLSFRPHEIKTLVIK